LQEETATEIAFSSETGILRNPSNSIAQRKANSAVRQYRHVQQSQAANNASRTREELEEQIADLTQKIQSSLADCKHNADDMTLADVEAAVKERNDWRKQRLEITNSEEWNQVRKARKRRKVATSALVSAEDALSSAADTTHSGSSGSSASSTSGAAFNSLTPLTPLTNTESFFSSTKSLRPFDTALGWNSTPPSVNPQNADITVSTHPFPTVPSTFSLQNLDFSYPIYSTAALESCELIAPCLFSFAHRAFLGSLIAFWSS
jgi:ABC-type transport system involved in cytochrome bd biosynthesis fused ATPase/permease subunit